MSKRFHAGQHQSNRQYDHVRFQRRLYDLTHMVLTDREPAWGLSDAMGLTSMDDGVGERSIISRA